MDKKQIEQAAKEYRMSLPYCDDPKIRGMSIGGYDGFIKGAEWANNHQQSGFIDLNKVWIYAAQKEPEDGEYLTIIRTNGQTIIELAPWRNGKYQGRHHFGVEISRAEVIMYANVADLLPHTSRLIE